MVHQLAGGPQDVAAVLEGDLIVGPGAGKVRQGEGDGLEIQEVDGMSQAGEAAVNSGGVDLGLSPAPAIDLLALRLGQGVVGLDVLQPIALLAGQLLLDLAVEAGDGEDGQGRHIAPAKSPGRARMGPVAVRADGHVWQGGPGQVVSDGLEPCQDLGKQGLHGCAHVVDGEESVGLAGAAQVHEPGGGDR